MCFQRERNAKSRTIKNRLNQGVEVCADEVVDQLLRGGLHLAAALQHHANHQVLDQLDQEDGGQGEETLGQVQRSRGSRDPAPGHHALHCQEVCTSQSMKVGSHRDEILTNAKCYFAPPSWILISPPYKNLVYKFIVGLSCIGIHLQEGVWLCHLTCPTLSSIHALLHSWRHKKATRKIILVHALSLKEKSYFSCGTSRKVQCSPTTPLCHLNGSSYISSHPHVLFSSTADIVIIPSHAPLHTQPSPNSWRAFEYNRTQSSISNSWEQPKLDYDQRKTTRCPVSAYSLTRWRLTLIFLGWQILAKGRWRKFHQRPALALDLFLPGWMATLVQRMAITNSASL